MVWMIFRNRSSEFELAWKLSTELNNYENERLVSCRSERLSVHFIAPKARQILHETAHRAFARCECA